MNMKRDVGSGETGSSDEAHYLRYFHVSHVSHVREPGRARGLRQANGRLLLFRLAGPRSPREQHSECATGDCYCQGSHIRHVRSLPRAPQATVTRH